MSNQEPARIAIILAGGLGKRMQSSIPKVLHTIHDKPMIIHILENCLPIVDQVFVIVGKYRTNIQTVIESHFPLEEDRNKIGYVDQQYPMGTGHAVQCAKPYVDTWISRTPNSRVLILSGDVPLLSRETMLSMFNVETCENTKMLVTRMDKPYGYGRIILDENNNFIKIVEEKDTNNEEKMCNLVNCGIYSFHTFSLFRYILKLNSLNSQKEYYLTDMVAIVRDLCGSKVELAEISREKQYEVLGVNTIEELIALRGSRESRET